MFSKQQSQIIYHYFPVVYCDESDKKWYKRCNYCFVETVEDGDLCFYCMESKFSELFVVQKILIKIYRKYGLSHLKQTREILDPHNKIENLYEKCMIHVLHKPQKLKELLEEGANPNMDFGKVTGNSDFTLLSWCIKENEVIAIELLVNSSKNGEIFKKRNCWNHTALGYEIVELLRNDYSSEYHRYNIKKLIELGSKIEDENLNNCGISILQYEDKLNRQNNIKWLLDLGIKYDLYKCIVFGCEKIKGGSQEICGCGVKRLKETRLGKFLSTIRHK